MQLKRALLLGCVFGSGLLDVACNTPDPNATTEVAPPQDLAPFRPVEEPMGLSCGSLDCHGQPGRNFRLYDAHGRRLSPTDIAGVGATTDAEVDSDVRSLVGLEPDLTNQVLADKGASPDRLTLIRKARGSEAHKGGTVWPEGSDGDRCLVSWMSGHTDEAACARTTVAFTAPP